MPESIIDQELVGNQIVAVPNNDATRVGIEIDDVARFCAATRQPFALPNGEKLDPIVLADTSPIFIVDPARMKFSNVRFQKRFVVVARNKTNLLTVHLVRCFQPKLPRNFPDLALFHAPNGKKRALELRLAQTE